MDPQANLKEQLELAKSIIEAYDQDGIFNALDITDDAARLAELVIAMHEWTKMEQKIQKIEDRATKLRKRLGE